MPSRFAFTDNDLTILIKAVEAPGEPPARVARLDWSDSHPGIPPEDVVDELIPPFDSEWGPPPFVIDITHSYYSWGASHSGAELILQIAAGALGTAGWELLKASARRLKHRMWRGLLPPQPLTLEEARSRAAWIVAGTYDVDEQSLVVVAESEAENGGRAVTLRSPHHSEFHVVLEFRDELVFVTRLGQQLSGPSSPLG